MRAIRRLVSSALSLAAAIAITAGPAVAPAAGGHGRPLADCPAGSNWDNILQRCV